VPGTSERARPQPRFAGVSLAAVLGLGIVVWGVAIGLLRIHDNSFLTHLATGRIILAHGVPSADPYSFTARGHPWVVESWLASVLYAEVDRLWRGHGLLLLHAATTGVLAGLVWRLTRPAGTLVGRLAAAAAALAVGTGYWTSRPLLLALLALAVVVLAAETDTVPAWVLVPVLWLWVQVHGSWPLALVYLGVRAVGRAVDHRALKARSLARLGHLAGAAAAGAVLGVANPLGWHLLAYPLTVVTHHRALAHIVEWQSPSFADPVNAVLLVELGVALALLVIRRGSAEDALIALVFGAAAAVASRNVPVASLVAVPVLARTLRGAGSLTGTERRRAGAAGALALVAVGAVLVAGALQRPELDLHLYPVAEVQWMQQRHLVPGRVVAPDIVGNYLEYRYGRRASVFIDDRADMYPLAVVDAAGDLLAGRGDWSAILDRYRASSVLWPADEPLAGLVSESPRWRVVLRDRHWVVAVRASVAEQRAPRPAQG